jgi:MFS family permease
MSRLSSRISRPGMPLIAARFITMLGTGMAPICLAAGGLATPSIGAGGLGFIMGGLVLGEILFTLYGGALADRVGAASSMVCGDLLAFAAEGGITVLFAFRAQSTIAVTCLTFLLGTGAALSNPAGAALVRQICKDDELVSVNGWVRSAGVLARVLGAPAGGLIAATGKPTVGIGVDAATFLCSAGLISLVAARQHISGTRWRGGVSLADVRAGWQGFRGIPWLLPTAIGASVVNGARNAGNVLIPAVLALAGYGPQVWGLVFGLQMAGNVVALWTLAKVKSRHALATSFMGVVLVGICYIAIAYRAPLPAIGALTFLAGGSISNFGIRFDLTVQRTVPEAIMSRVMAVTSMFSLALAPIATATLAPLILVLGRRGALAFWGIAALTAIVCAGLSKPVLNSAEPSSEESPLVAQQ